MWVAYGTYTTLNQNTPLGWGCGAGQCGDPAGFGVEDSCSGGNPLEGGECAGGFPRAGGCPAGQYCQGCDMYAGECCNFVPGACQVVLGCSGGSPTPTPTPQPSCTLSCPGTEVSESEFNNATGGAGGGLGQRNTPSEKGVVAGASSSRLLAQGVGGGLPGTTTTQYYLGESVLSGNITFLGESGFTCQEFVDGILYQGPCPSPTLITPTPPGGGGGGAIGGVTTVRDSFDAGSFFLKLLSNLSFFKPIRDVLGLSTSQTLVQGVGGGEESGSLSTWQHPVTYEYLDGSNTKVYTALASSGEIIGGIDDPKSNSQSCSCKVGLSCPLSVTDINDPGSIVEGCDDQYCDFSVDPSRPQAGIPAQFTLMNNNGFRNFTIDYGDGQTESYPNAESPLIVPHIYANAGAGQQISLTCSNPGGNIKTCVRRATIYCDNTDPYNLPTPTLSPTPSPSPSPTPGPWLKLKDTSFTIRSSINNVVPAGATQYDDTSDTGVCRVNEPTNYACFSSGETGSAIVKSDAVDFGAGLSQRDWLRKDANYVINTLLTPSSFISYVKARKDYATITSLTQDQIQSNMIHLLQPDPPIVIITDDTVPDAIPAGAGAVIIIDGDLVIDLASSDTFNAANKAIAFVINGTLEISSQVTELNGIFIANDVNYAFDAAATSNPLKINGNISLSQSPTQQCNDVRQRIDPLKPSCFFTFDFVNQYVPVIDLLSTRTYDWSELTP